MIPDLMQLQIDFPPPGTILSEFETSVGFFNSTLKTLHILLRENQA
jgi:hypothetical protein